MARRQPKAGQSREKLVPRPRSASEFEKHEPNVLRGAAFTDEELEAAISEGRE